MTEINAKEARRRLGELLSEVENGETYTIVRKGKVVARLLPVRRSEGETFPDLSDFRASIQIKSKSFSAKKLIRAMRDEERH